jgi:hypothetical protein
VEASLVFDVANREARGRASVAFEAGSSDGLAALDLRQDVTAVSLDGRELEPDAVTHQDLGGGPGAEMRVLDVELEAGSPHLLEVEYTVDTPACTDAVPVGWTEDGVRFDLWMSDLHPGRYLEMWLPAPLVHDRFSLRVDVSIEGSGRPHTLIANTGGVETPGANRWTVLYPAHFTALSPMMVIAPSDTLEIRRGAVQLPGKERSLGLVVARQSDSDADLGAAEADIRSWLTYLATRYEPWVHGDTFTAVMWGSTRGMEYDGATTASVAALEHEVFHSWFGRGVKPARASDGWIDEAFTSWSTASRRSELPRFASSELGLDQDPVELYPPHAWSRHTPPAAYVEGALLFAGLADRLGGPDRLRSCMADWYRANAGRLVTTDGLAAHIKAWSGMDIGPLWARYVHGRG